MVEIVECDQYSYSQHIKTLHFGREVVVSNPIGPHRYDDAFVYFNRQAPCFNLIAEKDEEIILYRNSDLIKHISSPKSFMVSAKFEKALLCGQYFDSHMQFNQWCFDNDLTHKLLKKQVQINAYFDPFTRHPMTGDLCVPPILLAKHHPDLNLSSSLAEIIKLDPIIVPIKKGQGIHFDKHHYQCIVSANVRFLKVADEY